jgi:hypothetical protein
MIESIYKEGGKNGRKQNGIFFEEYQRKAEKSQPIRMEIHVRMDDSASVHARGHDIHRPGCARNNRISVRLRRVYGDYDKPDLRRHGAVSIHQGHGQIKKRPQAFFLLPGQFGAKWAYEGAVWLALRGLPTLLNL